ncbi:ribonuclease H-like domain-containing protein [Tanacetum coccineum]
MVPRAVLMKSDLVSINTARQVNDAHSKTTVNATRPMDKNVNTARPKALVNAVKGNNINAVKASACWVWKPKTKVLDHGNPQMDLQDKGVIDSGCSRHMTGNMSYLTDYEEIDGGYVAFGGNPKGGKITEKGKQHRASCKSKTENSISLPLHLLHMDLFGPTFVKSLMKKMYCLVVTDDYSRFTWVFFLATKDETSGILKSFITGIENLVDHKVKVIRCDNGTEFKNREMNQFCEKKVVGGKTSIELPDDPNMPSLEDISIFDISRDNEDVGAKADMTILGYTNPIIHPPTRIIEIILLIKQSDLVSKRIERNVNAARHKLNTAGLLLLLKVNAARHNLQPLLKVNTARYALTINPTIYTSCIEQFWATVKAKTVNGEVQLQALVDGKKIIITESIARRDLQLEDAEGVDCLPNATIFEQLTLISMVKNLENVPGKFLMYPRFVQVFLDKQLEGMPNQAEMGEGSAIPTYPHHTPTIIQPSTSQPQKAQKPRRPKRKDTEIPQSSGPTDNVADEAVYGEMDDSLERAATTATSLDAEHDRGNINKTQSKATLNEPSSLGTSLGSGPRRQETMRDTIAQTRSENKRRVKKLERRNKSRTHRLKRLYKVDSSRRVKSYDEEGLGEEDASKQGSIADIDANEDIYLVNVQTDEDMFCVNDLDGDEVIVESVDVNTVKETRTLAELKSEKSKADKVVIQEPEKGTTMPTLTTTTDATTITTVSTRPRAKGVVIHEQEQAPTSTVSSQQPS